MLVLPACGELDLAVPIPPLEFVSTGQGSCRASRDLPARTLEVGQRVRFCLGYALDPAVSDDPIFTTENLGVAQWEKPHSPPAGDICRDLVAIGPGLMLARIFSGGGCGEQRFLVSVTRPGSR